MVVESPLTITPPKAIPATGFDLTTLTAGRIVEARVTALAGQMATLASRHGPLEVDLGAARAAVGDVLRFEVRSIAGEDGQTTLQLALSSGSGEAKTAGTQTATVADPVQQALGRAVAKAVATQSGLAPLYATLAGLAAAPSSQVPEPIRALIGQLMGGRLAASGPPTAKAVAAAFRASGLFSESQAAAPDGDAGAADLKTTLTGLRAALTQWVGGGGARPSAAGGAPAPTPSAAGGATGASAEAAPETGAGPSSASGLAVRAAYGAAGGAARPASMGPETEGGAARLAAFAYGAGATSARPSGATGTPPAGMSAGAMPTGATGAEPRAAGAGAGPFLEPAVTGAPTGRPAASGADPLAAATRAGGVPSEPASAAEPGATATRAATIPTMPSANRGESGGAASGTGTPPASGSTTPPAASAASPLSPSPPVAASAPASSSTSAVPAFEPGVTARPAEVRAAGVPAPGSSTTPAAAPTGTSSIPPAQTPGGAASVPTAAPTTSAATAPAAPAEGAPSTPPMNRELASGAGPTAATRVPSPGDPAGVVDRSGPTVVGSPASSGTTSAGAPGAAPGSVSTGPAATNTAPPTPAQAASPAEPTAPPRGAAAGSSPPGPSSPPSAPGAIAPAPIGRGEAGLLAGAVLESALPAETGEAMLAAGRAAVARERGAKPPPPPRKGQAPVAQAAAPNEVASSDGIEGMGRRALERTEGALQRILLEQYVTLDTHGDEAVAGVARGNREWTAELPLATQTGTSIVQMSVERDGGGANEREAGAVGWRVRFALDVEPIGPVHAQIGLSGDHLSVGLWIERPEMAARLAEDVGQLTAALADSAVTVEPVRVQIGTPPVGRAEGGSPSGHFIDVSL